MTWCKEYDQLLLKYAKPIVHMRAQNRNRRLSLILGSGVSKPLGVPNWEELVQRLAKEIQGEALLATQEERSSITSKIQLLFEHFQRNKFASGQMNEGSLEESTPFPDPWVKKYWQDLVRRKLYETVQPQDDKTLRSLHPYLGAFIDVIRNSPMTVNYNFDHFVERMLSELNREQNLPISEGYETVWDINLQFKSNAAIIYHPNGYLPRDPLEKGSDWLVFSEDEYADQLIYSMTGYFSSLAHHLSKSTCLLIGLSLEDSTLRHLLRQSAMINPGHYHYYVAFIKDGKKLNQEEAESIKAANFEVYNLITLFLSSTEIKALGELIVMEDEDFRYNASEHEHAIKYCFYVTGAIGAGKSTVVSYFRSLQTHDEWTEGRPPVLAKYPGDLTNTEKKEADTWIASQFNRKNWDLSDSKDGIHIIDRSPLDPLGFTEEEEWPEKANFLLTNICGTSSDRKIQPGQVILLMEDPGVLLTRIKPVQYKGYKPCYLEEQQKKLEKAYTLSSGVTKVDTKGKTLNETIKAIARIIHMQQYEPSAQLHERLEEIINERQNSR